MTAAPMRGQAAQAAPQARATAPVAQNTTAGGAPERRAQESRRPTKPMAGALGRLTAATVLACSLNGVAAYAYLQSDAVEVSKLAGQQATTLQEVTTTVDSLADKAGRAARGTAAEDTYLSEATAVSGKLTTAAARAASGPTSFDGDEDTIAELSSSYTDYVAALERARATTGSRSTASYAEAQSIRSTKLDPVLTSLSQENDQRRSGAELGATLTNGALAATTLAALAALLGGSVWLARRTKRLVNPGLLGATLATAAVSGYAFAAVHDASIVNGPYTAPAVLLGGLTAAGLAWWGLEQRRKEYR